MSVLHAHILALALIGLAGTAAAETVEPEAPAATQASVPRVSLQVTAVASDEALAALTGGAEMVAMTEQSLKAINSGNAVNADIVNTGAVTMSANAFSGFAGIGNFVINTGNNNNLQGSLSVNIVLTPGS